MRCLVLSWSIGPFPLSAIFSALASFPLEANSCPPDVGTTILADLSSFLTSNGGLTCATGLTSWSFCNLIILTVSDLAVPQSIILLLIDFINLLNQLALISLAGLSASWLSTAGLTFKTLSIGCLLSFSWSKIR